MFFVTHWALLGRHTHILNIHFIVKCSKITKDRVLTKKNSVKVLKIVLNRNKILKSLSKLI